MSKRAEHRVARSHADSLDSRHLVSVLVSERAKDREVERERDRYIHIYIYRERERERERRMHLSPPSCGRFTGTVNTRSSETVDGLSIHEGFITSLLEICFRLNRVYASLT